MRLRTAASALAAATAAIVAAAATINVQCNTITFGSINVGDAEFRDLGQRMRAL